MGKQFNSEMLVLARQLRRLSQQELARNVPSVTQSTLSKIERGQIIPDEKTVQKFAEALTVSPSFLMDGSYRRMPPVSYHRKRRKLSARDLDAIDARAEVYRINLKKLFSSLDFETDLPLPPALDPDQFDKDISKIADTVRQRWSIPRGPITSLTTLIEKSGVVIVPFDFGTPLIDGFAQHEGDGLPPIIFLNSKLSTDRLRFSLAHELGHVVMHHTPNPDMEFQANLFASSFLMPKRDIENEFNNASIQRFMDLKLYWGVSIQALIYKAWELGKMSDRMYKYYNIEISKRGWRKDEPVEIRGFDERAKLLKAVITAHTGELGYSNDQLSELCGLPLEELQEMYPIAYQRPHLKLVT